ncbi:SDR family NAD(P)-dependent oxidoreductase [Dactylosporangium sucinum]|uniref:3-oxoacyl-ACP reductase n=1 Tax=Dactylosporangium sucinum TaxID=1424081 RepID=A0A917X5T4_9ACTN|nr:SDR family oxidoreductase [Dactylosporangium sucinum]GGM83339.1 3-oxoacyl-ACP reductase [Dactylosporangium sucinum]
MRVDVRGKVIVVTGAARGLGAALAEALVREGARVAVLTRSRDRSEQIAHDIAARHPGQTPPMPVVADVADEAEVMAAARVVDERWNRVDALINNAAWIPPHRGVLETSVADLRRVLDSNFVGCVLTTKHFAPLMIRGGGGRIVYLSSIIGLQANAGQSAYGASKAAVNLLNEVVHRELGDQGIRTVALAPGLTDTPGMRASLTADRIAAVAATHPGGRLGQPEDIIATVTFLCSDEARHLSGVFVPMRPSALAVPRG